MSELQELTVKELITKIYNTQHQLQRNTAYAVGDIATSPDLPSWAYLECVQAGTTSSTPPQQFSPNPQTMLSDGSVQWRVRDIRCRYEVGDLVPKLTTPKSYEYLMLCDGSSFDTSEYPLLAEVFPDGILPNLNGRVLEGSSLPKQYFEAGLPNITGSFKFEPNLVTNIVDTETNCIVGDGKGAFYTVYDTVTQCNYPSATTTTWNHDSSISFDASRSNGVYGRSNTVQMAAYGVTYYVCYGG